MSTKRQPKYRFHKASGQAVVTIDGRDVYLGAYDSIESHAEYKRVVGDWLRTGSVTRADGRTTVVELVDAYLKSVELAHGHKAHGKSLISRAERSLALVTERYGLVAASEFGPKALKNVR